MKKFLTGLIIALITFTVGIAAFENLDPESIVIPGVVVEDEEIFVCDSGKESSIEFSNDEDDVDYKFTEEEDFFNGWYALDDRMIKGINEVRMVSLARNEDYDYKTDSREIASFAGVFTTLDDYGDQGFFSSVSTQIKGNKVKFRTEKIKGISYNFEGVFFKNKTMGKEGEELLRGTLQKFVKGKKAAEVSGDFAYYEPHCWH